MLCFFCVSHIPTSIQDTEWRVVVSPPAPLHKPGQDHGNRRPDCGCDRAHINARLVQGIAY